MIIIKDDYVLVQKGPIENKVSELNFKNNEKKNYNFKFSL